MIEVINKELLKLQNELGKFQEAVKAIKKSNESSDNLIESMKQLQESFKGQLEKIEKLFSDYMNKTYRHSEEKVNQIYDGFAQRVEKEEQTLSRISQLAEQNENLLTDTLKKISDSHKTSVQEYTNKSIDLLNEQQDYLKLKIEEMKKNISSLIDEHNNHLKKQEKVLDNYIDLAGATAELSKFLKTVDFPSRLDKINKNIDLVHSENKTTNQKIDNNFDKLNEIKKDTDKLVDDKKTQEILEKVTKIVMDNRLDLISQQVTKNSKKISSTRFWTIMIFIISFLFYAFLIMVFFKLFPHFFADQF